MDFTQVTLENGKNVRNLNIIDDFTSVNFKDYRHQFAIGKSSFLIVTADRSM
jgi:hypothetical protein